MDSIVDAFASIGLLHWSLILLIAAFVATVLKLDSDAGNGFRLLDAFMDPGTSKASLDKLVIAFFAVLSAWAVVYSMTTTNHPIPDALVTILAIFVLKTTLSRGIDAKWGPPPPPDTPPCDDKDRR